MSNWLVGVLFSNNILVVVWIVYVMTTNVDLSVYAKHWLPELHSGGKTGVAWIWPSLLCDVKVRNEWRYTSSCTLCLRGMDRGNWWHIYVFRMHKTRNVCYVFLCLNLTMC
jgi:hypothetical protein